MRSWDTLRHEVRILEQKVEERLGGLSKLFHSLSEGSNGGQTAVLLQKPTEEIETLLGQLSASVDTMQSFVGSSPSFVHVHRSHVDVLLEYRREYKRIQTKIRAFQERNELFQGSRVRAGTSEDTALDVGMRSEIKSIDSATNAADATLATGWSIQEDLQRQRALFDNMMGSIDQMRGSVPTIGSLIESIKRKRKRDVIVISAVVAVCLTFTLIFVL